MIIWRTIIVLRVSTSQAWVTHSWPLCALTPGAVGSPLGLRAACRPPRGPQQLMEAREREWSSLAVHPCGHSHSVLFGPLYSSLGVKCQSGALEGPAQRERGSHPGGRSTPLFKSATENRERKDGLDSKTFTALVAGRSDLERQAAVLSKSQGHCPVELQRAAQQCLSQHINNFCVIMWLHPRMHASSR